MTVNGKRRPRQIAVAAALAALVLGGAAAVHAMGTSSPDTAGTRPMTAAGTAIASQPTGDDITATSVCHDMKRVDCAYSQDGALVIRVASKQGGPESTRPKSNGAPPRLLWEPGGPGLDVTTLLSNLPPWTNRFDVVVVPEPWTYQNESFCQSRHCTEPQLTGEQYLRTVEYAQTRWGKIQAVSAFSFGAVRVIPLLNSRLFRSVPFEISSPAPLPGTPGSMVALDRTRAARTAIEAVACGQRGSSGACDQRVRSAFTQGFSGLNGTEANLGLMSLAKNAADNGSFLRSLFAHVRAADRAQLLNIRRGAYTLALTGDPAARGGYLFGMCTTYPDWAGDTPFARLHEGCPRSQTSRTARFAPMLIRTGQPTKTAARLLNINTVDPATPAILQRDWARAIRASTVHYYRRLAHVSPPVAWEQRFASMATPR